MGNFSWNSVHTNIGDVHFRDPRPKWSGNPLRLAEGSLALSGQVEHLEPLMLPYLNGPLTAAEAHVAVSGDPDLGWHIALRGIDGNYYLRLMVDVVDGEGGEWHGEGMILHSGETIELPPEYDVYKKACDEKYARAHTLRLASLKRVVSMARVKPGEPVMDAQAREAIALRTRIAAGEPGALRELIDAGREFGPGIYSHIGRSVPLDLSDARTKVELETLHRELYRP
jgi:hypothetical protein